MPYPRQIHLLGLLLVSGVLASSCAHLGHDRGAPHQTLPLARLQLYETGVGYFERTGTLHGARATTLPVPAGHVDDALKTLTVTAENGKAFVSGVAFPSNLSHGMARALSGLTPNGKGPVSFRALLVGLRGQAVEIRLREGRLRGTPIDIKKEIVRRAPSLAGATKSSASSKTGSATTPPETHEILLFLDEDAQIRRVALSEIIALKPQSAAIQARLKTALAALSPSGRQKQRALKILSRAQGKITVGYLAETPLFRVSYRLFAKAGSKRQTLQGWALLHNDTDEDWRSVEVSLVSGRPDSFLFPMTVPRYLRRPLVHPKRALPSVPQLINTTPDAIWGDQLDSDGDAYGVGGMGTVGTGRGGGGSGYGRGYGRIAHRGTTSSAELKVGNLAAFSKAKASKNGTLFRYQLGQRLNLPAHSSAELPFTQDPLDARQITLFRDLSTGAARTATLFENTTQRTLPAGTIAFFAKGSFVGESFLPRTKPGMRHFLDYGRDLDLTRVIEEPTSPKVTPKAIYFKNGSLGEHFLRERKIEFTFKNTDSEARRVYVQLDVRKNASITGADALDFAPRTKTAYAIFSVPPLGHAKKTLVIKEGLERFINVFTLPRGQIKVLSQAPTLSNAVHGVFIAVLAKRKAFDSEKEKLRQNRRAEKRIKVTLARLRRHLSALGAKNGTVAAPLVKRILKMEDELEAKHALAQTIKTRKKEIRNETRSLLKKLPKA